MKTKKLTCTLAVVASFLLVAVLALCAPMAGRTRSVYAAQGTNGYYSTDVREVDLAELSGAIMSADELGVIGSRYYHSSNASVAVSQEYKGKADFFSTMYNFDVSMTEPDNKDYIYKRIQPNFGTANGAYIAYTVCELTLTFSIKFTDNNSFFYFTNEDSTWHYQLYISASGDVVLGSGLDVDEVYTSSGSDSGSKKFDKGTAQLQTGKLYQVKYTVQRLFGSENEANSAVLTAAGSVAGMRQSVEITSRGAVGSFDLSSENTAVTGFVTNSKANNNDCKLRFGASKSGGVNIASYYYSDDYEITSDEVVLDADDMFVNMTKNGIKSDQEFKTLDNESPNGLWTTGSTGSNSMSSLMQLNRVLRFRWDMNEMNTGASNAAFIIESSISGIRGGFTLTTGKRLDIIRGGNNPNGEGLLFTNQLATGVQTTYLPNKLIVEYSYKQYKSTKADYSYVVVHFKGWADSAVTSEDMLNSTSNSYVTPSIDFAYIIFSESYSDWNADRSSYVMRSGAITTDKNPKPFTISAVEFDREYTVSVVDDKGEPITDEPFEIKYGSTYNFTEGMTDITKDFMTLGGLQNTALGMSNVPTQGTWEYDEPEAVYDSDTKTWSWPVELTASYYDIEYTVEYDETSLKGATPPALPGEANEQGKITISNCMKYDLNAPTGIASGQAFYGWYLDSEYTQPVTNFDLTVLAADSKNRAKTITLYADIDVGITVTLLRPDGTVYSIKGFRGNGSTVFTFPAYADVAVDGYDIPTGWQKQVGSNWVDVDAEEKPSADVTYRAKAALSVYTITYDLDGGTAVGDNPFNYTIADNVTLKAAQKSGYLFLGWLDNGGNSIQGFNAGTRTGNLTLKANFVVNTLPSALTVAVGKKLTIPVLAGLDVSYTVKVLSGETDMTENVANNAITFAEAGEYKVVYDITLPMSVATHELTVTVVKPVITVSGSYNASYSAGTVLELLSANNNVDGEITIVVTKDGAPVTATEGKITLEAGNYVITYSADGADDVKFSFTVSAASGKKKGCGKGNSAETIVLISTLLTIVGGALISKKF